MDLKNKKLAEDDFFKERAEVLGQWPTGKEVDLQEAIAFHKSLPKHKVWTHKMRYAKEHGETYASSGMGKTTIEEHIDLLTFVEKKGKADILSATVDSFSRQNNYQRAQQGIEESIKKGNSALNGLPVVNHGVAGIRKIVEAVNSPIIMRYGAADPRLIDEIGLAGGFTADAADPLMDFWHHNARVKLEDCLRTHRYTHRLVGYYEEHGVPLCVSVQGLYGAGIPPSLNIAAILVEILMMAEQGVKNIMPHFAAHGNLAQDVATATVLRNLSQEYLNKAGHKDVEEYLSVSFSLVQYPIEEGSAFAVIFMNTLMAKLCEAQRNDIRTIAEAKGIPTKEDTAYSYRTAKAMENFLQLQKIQICPEDLEIEMKMTEKEVRSIIDKILELGDGDIVTGTLMAVKSGVLDHPFATNPASPAKVMGIKDVNGAVRFLNHGNLPFSKDIIEFHQEKIKEREKKQGVEITFETIVADLMAVSNGVLVHSFL
jgi:methylaspartate mutase epsilon subunit